MRIHPIRFGIAGALALAAWANLAPALATGVPSGERQVGQASIEPAYDDTTGSLVYLLTPENSPQPSPANLAADAPLYLVLYPAGSAGSVGTLNCMMVPNNCPDHNAMVAGAAMAIDPTVYGAGVLGHDHLVGIAPTGGDFNVAWRVVLVLFTSSEAAGNHITTLDQLDAAEAAGQAFAVPTSVVFNCSAVSSSAYAAGTPR